VARFEALWASAAPRAVRTAFSDTLMHGWKCHYFIIVTTIVLLRHD
jgi:hypothetical protein